MASESLQLACCAEGAEHESKAASLLVNTITYAHMTFDLLLMHGMQTSFTTICERMGFSQELSEFLCGTVIGCRMCTDQL